MKNSLPNHKLNRHHTLLSALFIFITVLLSLTPASSRADNAIRTIQSLSEAGYSVENINAEKSSQYQPEKLLVPASTLKLVTAYEALEVWGEQYQFKTEFYLFDGNTLYIRGLGDPYLISEELEDVADSLLQFLPDALTQIVIDTGYFSDPIKIQGQSSTSNPYDASPGAVAANFNSLFMEKINGRLKSAETQTPLTATGKRLFSQNSKIKKDRIAIHSPQDGSVHFGEILQKNLEARGIKIGRKEVLLNETPDEAKLIYSHKNSNTLETVISAMLKYSNNFIANQLFLLLGVERYGAPASIEKSQSAMKEFIEKEFGWEGVIINEGAGLSRSNRLSARQLTDLLTKFKPYRHLLPVVNKQIHAKTGTLKGVSTLAGYLYPQPDTPVPFAVLINTSASRLLRKQVAKELLQSVKKQY